MQRRHIIGIAFVLMGLAIAANAVLGPLVLGVIKIHESAAMETQLLGGELMSLCLAAPLAIVAGLLWWRGSPLASVVGAGPAGFALYTYIQFVLVPDYSRYAGNNEAFFPLYLILVMFGWSLLAMSYRAIGGIALSISRPATRALGILLVSVGSAFALAWIGSIAAIVNGQPTAEYLEHPTAFWLIRLMDLGFVIPIGLLTGIGLLRYAPWATRWAYAFVGTQTLLTCAVAGMAIRMWLRDDPAVTAPLLVVSTSGAAAFLVVYAMLIRGVVTQLRQSRVPFVLEREPATASALDHRLAGDAAPLR